MSIWECIAITLALMLSGALIEHLRMRTFNKKCGELKIDMTSFDKPAFLINFQADINEVIKYPYVRLKIVETNLSADFTIDENDL